jgi:hypothetical protein
MGDFLGFSRIFRGFYLFSLLILLVFLFLFLLVLWWLLPCVVLTFVLFFFCSLFCILCGNFDVLLGFVRPIFVN